jgi:hypothetical protein
VLAAICLSIPIHLALALWLSGILVASPAPVSQAVLVEAAMPGAEAAGPQDQEPGPREMPSEPLEFAPAPQVQTGWEHSPDPQAASGVAAGVDAEGMSTDATGPSGPGALAIGSGGGTGGVATSTFFGARGSGRRFAFIVDKSGSMSGRGPGRPDETRMQMALAELLRSVGVLPDFAQFRVCLFDTSLMIYPEKGFAKARAGETDRLGRWLQEAIPRGGTTPQVAFERIMGEGTPPDAIFFLTDGSIPAEDPAWIAQRVVSRGRTVPVHCIAFGDMGAAQQLEAISKATGGQFRLVGAGGGQP